MNATVHLVVTLVLCTALVRPLAGARWVWRSPRTGILLWQAVILTWVLCVVGVAVAVGLSPLGRDIPTAFARWVGGASLPPGFHVVVLVVGWLLTLGVVAALGWSWWRTLRLRRRHRDVLALVAREDAGLPGVLILDHPLAVAYCVPGLRSQVVLSSGALSALSPPAVSAVLAHEWTHARERHDLVLLPFVALRRVLPGSRLVGEVASAVELLVEMRADEGACRDGRTGALAEALRRFDPVVAPPGALGMADAAVAARLSRLGGVPLPVWVRWLSLLCGLTLVSTPLSFLVI